MSRVIALAVVVVAASGSVAHAEEPKPWSVDAAVGNEWLGGARPTGGLSVTVGGRYGWPIGEKFRLDAGVTAEAFGFAGGTHWMALIGGPTAGISYATPVEGLSVAVDLNVPYGRVPVCNDWGLCLRFIGWYPGGDARVSYAAKSVGVTAKLDVRVVDTLAWQGAGVGITGGGFVRW